MSRDEIFTQLHTNFILERARCAHRLRELADEINTISPDNEYTLTTYMEAANTIARRLHWGIAAVDASNVHTVVTDAAASLEDLDEDDGYDDTE